MFKKIFVKTLLKLVIVKQVLDLDGLKDHKGRRHDWKKK